MLYLEKVIKTSSASSASSAKGDKPFGDVGFTADDKADDKMVASSAVKDELIDKPFNNAGLRADDKADDDADDKMCNADDNKSNADDTFNADDKRTMKKNVIVRTQTTQYQQLSTSADDADDKNKTFSEGDAFTQFKLGDRVYIAKIEREGTIAAERDSKTPNGSYKKYKVDFGFDSVWFEGLHLELVEVAQ